MLLQPSHVMARDVARAVMEVAEKHPNPALSKLRVDWLSEGPCVTMMHVGPYGSIGPSVERMIAYAKNMKYKVHGKYHEIYISDPRRVTPSKMKTVLRLPVKKAVRRPRPKRKKE